jgi:1,2-diacylglycerol 3-alpha-glucosyltransferase
MRRVAMVIDPWDHPFNGTVVSARRFVAALAAAGVAFTLLTVGDGPAPAGCRRVGFPRLSIPGVNGIIDRMRAPLARPERERLRAALSDCDLLHVQFPFFLGHAAIGEARRLGIPVICSFHVQPENILMNLGLRSAWLSRVLYRVFIRGFYRPADQVIVPSTFAAELLAAHGLEREVEVLSNGVPDRFFDLTRAPKPAAEPFRVLSVGRLAREKDHATLLRAVAASRHRIELTLAGAGPRMRWLQALARRLGVAARIGPVSDEELMALYAGADLFVHGGAIELEGMSVLEAMAAGNVVVVGDSPASACGGLVGEARARFRSGDAHDLARRIDGWLDDPDARVAAGAANRRAALEVRHERSAARLVDIYRTCVAPSRPVASFAGPGPGVEP